MILTSIVGIAVGVSGIIIGCISFVTTHKINTQIDQENQKLEQQNEELSQRIVRNKSIEIAVNESLQQLREERVKIQTETQYMRNSLDNYQKTLDEQYKVMESQYDNNVEILKKSYDELQDKILAAMEEENIKLESMRATRIAAQKAMIREQEIKEKADFYCIQLSPIEKQDIKVLDSIKPSLINPRILCMLIWQTYYSKKFKALTENILGNQTICGIYKITNQLTNCCYIGQSVNIQKRWTDHAKCGLGIDTPQGNKLYAAMIKDDFWNFSWELLEECPKEELDKKEKYYIDLYSANKYENYNSTKGNK